MSGDPTPLATRAGWVAERTRQRRAEAAEVRLRRLTADFFDLVATARQLLADGPVEANQ